MNHSEILIHLAYTIGYVLIVVALIYLLTIIMDSIFKSKSKSLLVHNCHNCPLCNNDNESGYSCNHPSNELEQYDLTEYGEENLPLKCPLREYNLKIEITN